MSIKKVGRSLRPRPGGEFGFLSEKGSNPNSGSLSRGPTSLPRRRECPFLTFTFLF